MAVDLKSYRLSGRGETLIDQSNSPSLYLAGIKEALPIILFLGNAMSSGALLRSDDLKLRTRTSWFPPGKTFYQYKRWTPSPVVSLGGRHGVRWNQVPREPSDSLQAQKKHHLPVDPPSCPSYRGGVGQLAL